MGMKRIDINKSQYSCLNVIISSLFKSYSFPIQQSHLCEMYYHLLYQLCSNTYTSEAVLRFLRHFENFYATQLRILPSNLYNSLSTNTNNNNNNNNTNNTNNTTTTS